MGLDLSGDGAAILAKGIPGQGVIVAHGKPEQGAQWTNLDIDMEVHVGGRRPYQVNNAYLVPANVTIAQGVTLPIRVDPDDPTRVAIDWESAQRAPMGRNVPPA